MIAKMISLKDASGGLNNEVHPSRIATNELSDLANFLTDEGGWPGRKRFGKELLQYAPIDPSVYVADADTLGLWHLNEAASPYLDSSGNAHTLTPYSTSTVTAAAGLFGNGQRFARAVSNAGVWDVSHMGSVLFSAAGSPLLGATACTFEAWVNLDPSTSGKPVTATLAGQPRTTQGDSGACLVGTLGAGGGGGRPGSLINGLSVHRDWDSVAGMDAGDPYFKFTLNTKGVPGTQTVISSGAAPFNTWLHVMGRYSSTTGQMDLFLSGALQATAIPAGGGVVDDDSAIGYGIGGSRAATLNAGVGPLFASVQGVVDEARISTIARSTFPFKNPRGKPWPLNRSNGTKQLVVNAGDGLYYTVNGSAWTTMVTGLSATAYWEAQQVGDSLYLTDGVDSPLVWDGTSLFPWGEGTAQLTTAQVAGALALGTYSYYYTFLFGDEETGPSAVTTIVVASTTKRINITAIPLGPEGCTGRRVYRTKTGPGAVKYLLREIADNTTTAMTGAYSSGGTPQSDSGGDAVADVTLGTGAYVAMSAEVAFTRMLKPRYLASNFNRLFMGGMADFPYAVYWTEAGVPAVVRVQNFVQAEASDGEIRGLAPYYGELQVSKGGKSTLVLRGDNPRNWEQLETLHPTVGAIDHWSFVHRTIPSHDGYVLCFWGEDGPYAYAGHDFVKIGEKIKQTVASLVQSNSSRDQVSVTTQAQWEAAPTNGGSATLNLMAPAYSVDGTREVPGELRIVNQLDYIGLRNPSNPAAPGITLAVCRGVAQDEFFFSTDADNNLYHTTDNFRTAAALAGTSLAAGERIIEIVRRSTDDFYFLLCDSAGTGLSSGGGRIHTYDNGGGTWAVLYATALYYDLDVPLNISGNPSTFSGRQIGNNTLGAAGGGPAGSANNIFVNHQQNLQLSYTVVATSGHRSDYTVETCPSILGRGTAVVASGNHNGDGTYTASVATAPGFYAVFSGFTFSPLNAGNNQDLHVTYSRREFALWRGGTFRPQAFWDAVNSRLVFLASTPEDGNGNRSTYLRTLTGAGTLSNRYTAEVVTALANDGTSLWFATNASSFPSGFHGNVRKAALATPGTVSASSADSAYTVILRLSYNAQNSALLLATNKYLAEVAGQEFWTYGAFLHTYTTTTLVPSARLLALPGSGDSGPVMSELGVQTTTPYAWYAGVDRLTTVALYKVALAAAAAADVSIYQQNAYVVQPYGVNALGLRSPLTFVAASAAAGTYTWADRLYYCATLDSAGGSTVNLGQLLQLGVPGTWRVIGTYVSQTFTLASIAGFDSFDTEYENNVAFAMKNNATYLAVTPNAKLSQFFPPNLAFQWKLTLTWDYSVAAPTTTPLVRFAIVGYFTGSLSVPRIVAFHWKSRTYWAVARAGSANNDLVCVYQKNNTWTLYEGWALKGMNEFRGEYVALEDYQLIKLESGAKDLGNLIRSRARSGYIMDDTSDKMVRDVNVNILGWLNPVNPAANGTMKLRSYAGDTPLSNEWVFPILSTPNGQEPRQVKAVPVTGSFDHEYARALAIELGTSDETAGAYLPAVAQTENISEVILKLFVSKPRYAITGP